MAKKRADDIERPPNMQDATLKNIRALKKRMAALERLVAEMPALFAAAVKRELLKGRRNG